MAADCEHRRLEDALVPFEDESGQVQLLSVASLVDRRSEARRRHDFAAADAILRRLFEHRVVLVDQPDGSALVAERSAPPVAVAKRSGVSGRRRAAKRSADRQKHSRKRFGCFADFVAAAFASHLTQRPLPLILDVAGGSGELSWRLARRQFAATVVDPRALSFTRAATEKILCCDEPPRTDDSDEAATLQQRRAEMAGWLHAKTLQQAVSNERRRDSALRSLRRFQSLPIDSVVDCFTASWAQHPLVDGADLIVGLHPDQATDAIVDVALQRQKAFAVVPCCVFPTAFPDRQLNGVHVSSYDQLLDYLQAKHPSIRRHQLDGLGPRNVVLYAQPPYT